MVRPTNAENAIMQALTQVLQNQQNAAVQPPPFEVNHHGGFPWIASQLSRNRARTYGGEVDPVELS